MWGTDARKEYSICARYIVAMERYMMPRPHVVDMSADRRTTMGVKHLTVVPENFEAEDGDAEADAEESA